LYANSTNLNVWIKTPSDLDSRLLNLGAFKPHKATTKDKQATEEIRQEFMNLNRTTFIIPGGYTSKLRIHNEILYHMSNRLNDRERSNGHLLLRGGPPAIRLAPEPGFVPSRFRDVGCDDIVLVGNLQQ
jgi:hypothetical protein